MFFGDPTQYPRSLGPEALRCPELHDFSDLRESDGRVNRPLIAVLVLTAALTIGHFFWPAQATGPAPLLAQQQTTAISG
jgi:hypothetical protein